MNTPILLAHVFQKAEPHENPLDEYETPETDAACKTVKTVGEFVAHARRLEQRLADCERRLTLASIENEKLKMALENAESGYRTNASL